MSNLRPLPVTATQDNGIIRANAEHHIPFRDGDSYVVVSFPEPGSNAKSKITRGYTKLDQAIAALRKYGCPVSYAENALIAWFGKRQEDGTMGYYPGLMLTAVTTPTLPA